MSCCDVVWGFRASLHGWLGGPWPLRVLVAAGRTGRAAFPGCGCAGEPRAAQTPQPQPSSAFLFKATWPHPRHLLGMFLGMRKDMLCPGIVRLTARWELCWGLQQQLSRG